MMKKILLISFILISTWVNAQEITKTKKITTLNFGNLIINELTVYKDNKEVSNSIHWMAKDDRYMYITNLITVFYGSHSDFVDFVKKGIDFIENNEDGTRIDLGTHQLAIVDLYGIRCSIFPKGESGFSYTSKKQLYKILKKYNAYIKKQKK